jgi:hypothetical protein
MTDINTLNAIILERARIREQLGQAGQYAIEQDGKTYIDRAFILAILSENVDSNKKDI